MKWWKGRRRRRRYLHDLFLLLQGAFGSAQELDVKNHGRENPYYGTLATFAWGGRHPLRRHGDEMRIKSFLCFSRNVDLAPVQLNPRSGGHEPQYTCIERSIERTRILAMSAGHVRQLCRALTRDVSLVERGGCGPVAQLAVWDHPSARRTSTIS